VRKALNENPRVQLAVFGVGAVLIVVLMLTSLSGGGNSSEGPPTDPAAAGTPSTDPAVAAAPTTTPDPAAATTTPDPAATTATTADPAATPAVPPPTTSTAAAPTDTGSADGLLPSAGLPEDVLVAYAKGKAIALLVIDPKAVSDKQVEQYSDVLKSRDDVEYFQVKTKDIADYARITQGVAVSRTPALVVIRPRDKSGAAPTAIVSEGFRDPDSIRTALEDALYTGPDVPSYPK